MSIQEVQQIVASIVKRLGGKVSYEDGLQIIDICESLEDQFNAELQQQLKD